jgi:nucleotide-binding universal stress UspA family protein
MKRIIVATDGSEGAERAVDVAARIAKAGGSDLSILNVGGTLSGEEMTQLARAEGGLGDALEMLSNQILARARERAQRAGLAKVTTRIAWGDAAESIIEAATREHADAVVVGRRGRGRLAGLLRQRIAEGRKSRALCRDRRSVVQFSAQLRLTRIKLRRGAAAKLAGASVKAKFSLRVWRAS